LVINVIAVAAIAIIATDNTATMLRLIDVPMTAADNSEDNVKS